MRFGGPGDLLHRSSVPHCCCEHHDEGDDSQRDEPHQLQTPRVLGPPQLHIPDSTEPAPAPGPAVEFGEQLAASLDSAGVPADGFAAQQVETRHLRASDPTESPLPSVIQDGGTGRSTVRQQGRPCPSTGRLSRPHAIVVIAAKRCWRRMTPRAGGPAGRCPSFRALSADAKALRSAILPCQEGTSWYFLFNAKR